MKPITKNQALAKAKTLAKKLGPSWVPATHTYAQDGKFHPKCTFGSATIIHYQYKGFACPYVFHAPGGSVQAKTFPELISAIKQLSSDFMDRMVSLQNVLCAMNNIQNSLIRNQR